MAKGTIITEHIVFCGICDYYEYINSNIPKIYLKRNTKWICTDKYGWICPECGKKINKNLKISA